MPKVELSRDFTDYRRTVGAANLFEIGRKIKPPAEQIRKRAGKAGQWSLESPWQNDQPISSARKPTPLGKMGLDEKAMMKRLAQIARAHGVDKVMFHSRPDIRLSGDSIYLPKAAYAGLVAWHCFEKIQGAENNAEFEGHFQKGLDAFFSYLNEGRDSPAWARSAGRENRALVLFAIGILEGGTDFLDSFPRMKADGLGGPLAPFAPYRDQIEDHAARAKALFFIAFGR